ncbi:S-adenosylmethionine--tRNA ribosyltransferase-isomerase [Bryocella elongata]|uniref:S-adenosylmethionine:tRNA ribosyltransferase-isomerase n=1 Tax=Bryocella elongata TaxID=863522 RepID=A0A1H5W6B7_9BACT|nr:tRNA preQ1(34) S-adenosylmethionine ribosyltransferase-isomerase QueA [Bryocella elongata]SEF94711.1 S-adenosylmethionine--tRNA ribosyltransferase-isomerase [Bryocella elongata]
MLVSDFHFDLPEELIAQQPPAVRGSSRMLAVDRATGALADRQFTDLPSLLQRGDLLVMNDSRVLPARLFATRAGLTTQHNSPAPSGHIEVLLVEHLSNAEGHNEWRALVKPAKKVQPAETLRFDETLSAQVIAAGEFGERTLRFNLAGTAFYEGLDRIGHLPLPPYIHRDKAAPNTSEDRERYQTVFARERGSAAAPTAGLHFTPEVLEALRARGVELATITLHVGLGTFQPVRVDRTEDIRLHAEPYTLSEATACAINRATREGRRIVAVGTTTTRTLEHIARITPAGENVAAHSGSTSLFLSPGLNDRFLLVAGLLTNFHLPQSTLLMLVSAFLGDAHSEESDWGRQAALRAYAHAVAERYRFFSYGDCMLIT